MALCMHVCVCDCVHTCVCVFLRAAKIWVMSGNRVVWVIFHKVTQPNNETLMHTLLMEGTRQSKTYL